MSRSPWGALLFVGWIPACGYLLPGPVEYDSRLTCDSAGCHCAEPFADCDDDAENGCETVLTSDPSSCGACGHDCLGGACTDGVCGPATLFIGVSSGDALFAVSSTEEVYVADEEHGVIRIGAEGGPQEPVTDIKPPLVAADVALAGDSLFYLTTDSNGLTYSLFSSPLSSPSAPHLVASGLPTEPFVGVTSSFAYLGSPYGLFLRVSLDSGATLEMSSNALALVTGDDGAFWYDGQALWSLKDSETEPQILLPKADLPSGEPLALAVVEQTPYFVAARTPWSDPPKSEDALDIWSLSEGGGGPVRVSDEPLRQYAATTLFVDPPNAYVTAFSIDASNYASAESLFRVPLGSPGPPEKVANTTFAAWRRIVLKDHHMYWADLLTSMIDHSHVVVLRRLVLP